LEIICVDGREEVLRGQEFHLARDIRICWWFTKDKAEQMYKVNAAYLSTIWKLS